MPTDKLRIAMLSVHSCPIGTLGAKDTGGMSVYIRELARQLGEMGHSVDVYTRVHDPRDKQIVELGKNARLIHIKAGGDEQIHKLMVYSHLPDFACNLENFRSRDNVRYDLVYSHYWLSGWVGKYLQLWWDVPHMIMFHTLGAVKNAFGIGETEPELRIQTEGELAGHCHRIIASTEREKEDIIRHYDVPHQKISVIPCGVNLDLFRPLDKDMNKKRLGFADDRIILFVGRIEPLKGIDQMLRAMPCLQNGQRPRLIIIGGDDNSRYEMEKLRALSRSLRIEEMVTYIGPVKHEKLPSFYSAADLCVLPSYYESFGLVALESLACGTPVVGTDVGDLRSIIHQGKTGYVIEDNTPGQLADKIALFLAKPGQSAVTALSVRESVTRFGWPNIAEAIVRECRTVLNTYPALTS